MPGAEWSAGLGRRVRALATGQVRPIDLDSTMAARRLRLVAKEWVTRHHGYTGQRGYHPLLAGIPAGTGVRADGPAVRLR